MADKSFHSVTAPKSLAELAQLVGAELHNADPEYLIHDVSSLADGTDRDISFLDNIKYKEDFQKTKAGACIVSADMVALAPKDCALLISKNPYKSYALIAQAFYPAQMPEANISDTAIIAKTAKIGKAVCIEPGVIIGENVNIGDQVWIEAGAVIRDGVQIGAQSRIGVNATISHAIIGEACRIYTGARIGQDGFGFAIDPAGHVKVPQLGRVVIGNHVEIGANSCIDRGAGPDTVIGDGTWIDNAVQIGHNVQIGRGCVLVAQVGIAGSTIIEDFVVLAGQVGVAGHLKIGAGARIAAQSGILKDVPAGAELMGSPAVPIKQYFRQKALLKKLTKPTKA